MARDFSNRDRNVWERTGDEVRSWFGDEDADRRRRLDEMYANRMDRPDFRHGHRDMSDMEYERDYDGTYPGGRQDQRPYPVYGFGPSWQQHDSGHFRRRNLQQQTGYYGPVDTYRESFAGRGPSGYRRSAERIHEDLNEALTWDARLDAGDIEVSVVDNVVTLKGSVRDRFSKRRAEDLAESVRGVEDVHNHLIIASGSARQQGSLTPGRQNGSLDEEPRS